MYVSPVVINPFVIVTFCCIFESLVCDSCKFKDLRLYISPHIIVRNLAYRCQHQTVSNMGKTFPYISRNSFQLDPLSLILTTVSICLVVS